MTITVAVPTFGDARYLAETLESLRHQTQGVRVVVCDGGSSFDYSKFVGDEFFLLRPEKDPGMVGAWSKAASYGDSELIAFVADDNKWTNHCAEKFLSFFREFPECDVVFGEQRIIDENGKMDVEATAKMTKTYGRSSLQRGRIVPDRYPHLIHCNSMGFEACVIRRSVWEAFGPLECRAHGAFDIHFLWRILANGVSVGFCPDAVVEFRLHGNNYSYRRERQHCEGALWAVRHILSSCSQPPSMRRELLLQERSIFLRLMRVRLRDILQKMQRGWRSFLI
jgi:GT2 family glycosyltransferase